jgi:hypothetical protein
MPYLSDARSSKNPFQLSTLLSLIKKTAASTVAKDKKLGMSPWEALGESIAQLVQEASRLLPLTMEGENVVKGKLCLDLLLITFITLFQCLALHHGSLELQKSRQILQSTQRQNENLSN